MAKKTTKTQAPNSKKVREDLHLKAVTELKTQAEKIRSEMALAKVTIRAGREKNTRSGFNTRKLLARTLTVMREKELELKA